MNYEAPKTLAFYNNCPQVKLWDFKHIPVPQFAINCRDYRTTYTENKAVLALPDQDALEFYALNHLSAIVRKNFTLHEILPTWATEVMNQYQQVLRVQGRRMLNYMTLITTRESRHAKSKGSSASDLLSKFGKEWVDFNNLIKDGGSTDAVEKFVTMPPQMGLGTYVDGLVYCFYNGGFGGGFGGKPWGLIAKTLGDFINGHTSMEMLLDTAYTLAHNNGPMFNKGMMYRMYTPEIYRILDVQRSGQIPELVLSGYSPEICKDVKPLIEQVVGLFPNEFNDEVNWQQVEDLGSLHKYPGEKKKMKKKVPPKPKLVDGKVIIGQFEVLPGCSVDIIQRNAGLTI
jgi:hypothetical protein